MNRRSRTSCSGLVCAALLLAGELREASAGRSAGRERAAPRPDGHAVYVEGLGRGGLWGLGYDHPLHPRFCIGGVFSYYALAGDHVAVLAPYVGAYLVKRQQHRFFAHLGPQLMFVRTPSPVPEWMGRTAFGVSGALSTGYEYRRGVLLRLALMVTAGQGGVAPWLGASLGWAS